MWMIRASKMASEVMLIIYLLSAVTGVSLSLECPAPFGQPAATTDKASLPAIDLYLDEKDFRGGK